MTNPALCERTFQRILLIKPSAVGDVIHTLPVLAKLRARYPSARIDWLLTPAIADLIGHHPALSRVLLFPRQELTRPWRLGPILRLLSAVRGNRYDLVIDLHGQFRSAVLALASGARIRIGFDRPRRDLWAGPHRRLVKEAYLHGWTGAREGAWMAYTHRIPIPTLDVHAVDRYLWLGPLLGLDGGPPEFQVPVPPAAHARIDGVLRRAGLTDRPLTVLVPGTTWQTKHWHVEGFTEVARYLCRTGRAVILAGSANEASLCRAVVEGCPDAHDLCGQTTLSEMAALTCRAALCVTNDSGSMHLAVALGRPVVSIFGPTDPLWIGPYGRPNAVVRNGLPCAPCYLRRIRDCPNEHACMKAISAAQVIARIEATLAGKLQAAG